MNRLQKLYQQYLESIVYIENIFMNTSLQQKRSPMIFDLDSPNIFNFRKLSNLSNQISINAKQSIQNSPSSSLHKSHQKPKSVLKVPTIIKIDQVNSTNILYKNKNKYGIKQADERQDIMIQSDTKRKKVDWHREYSQPLEITGHIQQQHMDLSENVNIIRNKRQNFNLMNNQHQYVGNISSSNNNNTASQNIRNRMTSLEKYFEQTKSIQIPYKTKNRLHDNTRFLEQIDDFQEHLSKGKKFNGPSRVKKQYLNQQQMTQRKDNNDRFIYTTNKQYNNPYMKASFNYNPFPNNSSNPTFSNNHNRLPSNPSHRLRQISRPKRLQIQQLQSHNIKKYKKLILIQKILKQKSEQQDQIFFNNFKDKNNHNQRYLNNHNQRYLNNQNQRYLIDDVDQNKQPLRQKILKMQDEMQKFHSEIRQVKREMKLNQVKKNILKENIAKMIK